MINSTLYVAQDYSYFHNCISSHRSCMTCGGPRSRYENFQVRHFTARWCSGQVYRIECGQIHDLHSVSSADSLLTRQYPIVLDNAPMLAGIWMADSRPLLGNGTCHMIEIPQILIVSWQGIHTIIEHAWENPSRLVDWLIRCPEQKL